MNSFNEGVCLNHENVIDDSSKVKTYNRWPTKHRQEQFGDRLQLFVSMCRNDEEPNTGFFIHSSVYYVRAALEAKFNRHFSKKEVVRIINDKSWQQA